MDQDPYAPAAEAGIRRMAIPTPFAVGRVNVYLIEDDPLTLVDAGPNSGSSLDELQRQLAGHGYAIEDLELILITHQHIDHIGLVEIVASHSGAEVAAIAIGLSVGFVLGVTSAGSGALIAVGLIMVFKLTPHRVVGTDVFHAAIVLWAAAIGHVASGNVDFGLMLNLLAGSIPGVWIGTAWSGRIPQPVLRHALGIVLITASVGLALKADASIPTATVLAVPVVLSGAVLLNHRRERKRGPRVRSEPAPARP